MNDSPTPHFHLPTAVTARAYAKVNLHLGVGDLRPDGYHDLTTVFHSLSLSDTVTLTAQPQAQDPAAFITTLTLDSSVPAGDVPLDSTNLAWAAAHHIATYWATTAGITQLPAATLHITKDIPVTGGMAGGSADAAAALVAADAYIHRAWPHLPPMPPADMHRIAARLGADVPFSLAGGTALGTGTGTDLVPMLSRGTYWWALATSSKGLSTPAVFTHLDTQRAEMAAGQRPDRRIGSHEALAAALAAGDIAAVGRSLANDLQPAALSLAPALRTTLAEGLKAGALGALVSGSGPTCAFLCDSRQLAQEVAVAVAAVGTTNSTAVAYGPTGGAHLVEPDPAPTPDSMTRKASNGTLD